MSPHTCAHMHTHPSVCMHVHYTHTTSHTHNDLILAGGLKAQAQAIAIAPASSLCFRVTVNIHGVENLEEASYRPRNGAGILFSVTLPQRIKVCSEAVQTNWIEGGGGAS